MSGIYLEEDGSPENSVSLDDIGRDSHNNTYASLLPSSSQSQLLPIANSVITRTSDAYLQACNSSCSSRRHRSIHSRHRSGRNRSTSSSSSEEIKNLYLKIKLGFIVLCTFNVLVVVFCVLINPKLGPFFADDEVPDFLETDGQVKTFKLCTKCQPLEAKVGTSHILKLDIRSSKYPEYCCFRRVDQLLGLVDWYAKEYVRQESDTLKELTPVKTNVTYQAPKPVFAHTYYAQEQVPPGKDNEDVELTWMTEGIDIRAKNIKLNSRRIVILETGFYYVYSHLRFSATDSSTQYRHKLLVNESEKGKEKGDVGEQGIFSVVQGIFKLKTYDILTVSASFNTLVKKGRVNYFGIYKLY